MPSLDPIFGLFLQIMGAAITIGTIIGMFKRAVINPMTRKIDDLGKDLKLVMKEVKPNGGTSLRDAVGRIEDRLEINTSLTRGVMENDPRGIFQTTAAGEVEWVNRTYRAMTNNTTEALRGRGWISHIHPADRERVSSEFFHCVEDKRQFHAQFHMVTREGEAFSVEAHAFPLISHAGKLLGMVGSIQNTSQLVLDLNKRPAAHAA